MTTLKKGDLIQPVSDSQFAEHPFNFIGIVESVEWDGERDIYLICFYTQKYGWWKDVNSSEFERVPNTNFRN